jgi:hypothetical protein
MIERNFFICFFVDLVERPVSLVLGLGRVEHCPKEKSQTERPVGLLRGSLVRSGPGLGYPAGFDSSRQ